MTLARPPVQRLSPDRFRDRGRIGVGARRDDPGFMQPFCYSPVTLRRHGAGRDPPATAVCVAPSCGSTGTRHAIARYVCVPLLGGDNRPDGAAAPGPVCGRGVSRASVCRGAPLPVRSLPPGGKIPAGSLVWMGAIRSHPITFRTAGGGRAVPPRPDPRVRLQGAASRSDHMRSDPIRSSPAGRKGGRVSPGSSRRGGGAPRPDPITSGGPHGPGRIGGLRFVPGLLHIDRQTIGRLWPSVGLSPALLPAGVPGRGLGPERSRSKGYTESISVVATESIRSSTTVPHTRPAAAHENRKCQV